MTDGRAVHRTTSISFAIVAASAIATGCNDSALPEFPVPWGCSNYERHLRWTTRLDTRTLSPLDVAIAGHSAFLVTGTHLVSVDISDPRRPVQQEDLRLPSWASEVEVAGNHAYLNMSDRFTTNGIGIADLADPRTPRFVSTVEIASTIYALKVSGETLFAATADGLEGPRKLRLYDVRTPTSPELVGDVDINAPGPLDVAGNLVVLAQGAEGLLFVDVSNRRHPEITAKIPTARQAIEVAMNDNYAYVAGIDARLGVAELYVVSLRDPERPLTVHAQNLPGIGDFFIQDDVLYVGDQRIFAYDIRTPRRPRLIGNVGLGYQASALASSQGFLFAANPSGLAVVEIGDAHSAPALAQFSEGAASLAMRDNLLYVGTSSNGVEIFDISDPLHPTLLNVVDAVGTVSDIALANDHAYIVVGWGLLLVYDLATPTSPRFVTLFESKGSILDLEIDGDHLYIAGDGQPPIFDISNPTQLSHVASLGTGTRAVAVENGFAYVANGSDGFKIFDVSDPTSPTLVGESPVDEATEIAVVGSHAYVGDETDALVVFDVSNPASPGRAAGMLTPRSPHAIVASGTHVYVVSHASGLLIADVSRPTAPQMIGGRGSEGTPLASAVALKGDVVFVADWDGVSVLPAQCE
jgi:hypothetical protein